MILLVSGTFDLPPHLPKPLFGNFFTLKCGLNKTLSCWAADNGAYSGFDQKWFLYMLKKLQGDPPGLFVTCPDVVGDALQTRELFEEWEPIIRQYDHPVAYVAQDNIENTIIPWERFECLFIGGTTDFKISEQVRQLAKDAKDRGKWLHMGRVNSRKRMIYAREIGVDSIDGSNWTWFRDLNLPKAAIWLEALNGTEQPCIL